MEKTLARFAHTPYAFVSGFMRTGATLYGYRLERRMGSGAFSEVWAARRPDVSEPRALKILRSPVAEMARARLTREIAANERVEHRAICRFEGTLPDEAGIVLELLSGPSLEEHLEDGPLDPAKALMLFAWLFPALDTIHAAGIVHRDLSPANVVLDRSVGGKLIDFGMAKLAWDLGTAGLLATTEDTALGSLVHAAPEQIDDPRTVDGKADLYGLGSCLFMALAGRPAFRAPTIAALLVLKAHRDAPSHAEVTSRRWPEALEGLLGRLLTRDPSRRPASGREVGALLARLSRPGES